MVYGLVKQSAETAPAGPSATQEEVAALTQRFEEAVAVLKKVRLSAAGKKPGLADMVSLSGRQFLYQLPWYIFIGAPVGSVNVVPGFETWAGAVVKCSPPSPSP